MSDGYHEARSTGADEVIIPAPCAITMFCGALTAAGELDEVNERLVVGWNASGSPVVVGNDGGLSLLGADDVVTDMIWRHE